MSPMNPPIRDWPSRRVWIVGASSGIGAALARQLVSLGATVAVTARREAELIAAIATGDRPDRAALEAAGHRILPADISDGQALAHAHAVLQRDWGNIDLVVWMAAAWSAMRAHDIDLATAHRMLDVNLGGTYNGLAVTLPPMIARGRGAVAIVASVAGYRGLPKALVYGPTKAALINLAESLYLDLHPLGIGVTLIAPGFVETPLTATNDFKMPALISADEAARHIVSGLERGRFEIHFPRRFTLWLKLLQWLPYRWYFPLVSRITGADRPKPPAGDRR